MLQASPPKTGFSPYIKRFFVALSLAFFSLQVNALDYCAAKGSYSYYEYIKGVSINGVSSTSAGQGYTLFSTPTFPLYIGNNAVTLTPGFSSTSFNEGWSVFIDLNQDGAFTPDERLLATTSSTTVNGTLAIPASAKPGPTRLRAILQYSSFYPIGCGTFYYGEVEDYTVNIGGVAPPPPPPPVPTKISTSTNTGFDHSYNKELVVNARFSRDGVIYNSTSRFFANGAPTRPTTFDVDINTKIEWTAQVYLDDSPAGVFIPANCTTIIGNKCITMAGAVGESVIFKEQPPVVTIISTTTTAGYDHSYNKDLVIKARYSKNGVIYNSSNFYYANSSTIASPITLDVDSNTQIEWSAQVYLDDSAAGVLIPANCKTVVANKCTTPAGAIGEVVIFKEQPPVIPPVITIPADLTLNFENLFGGLTYKAGPTIDLSNGITANTTASYFYNSTGAPFTSGYFSFIDLTLNFPAPVLSLNFKAAGSCTNCTQTVTVTADGQVVSSFTLTYNQVVPITVTLPTAAKKISFNQNFKMDDLAIDFQ